MVKKRRDNFGVVLISVMVLSACSIFLYRYFLSWCYNFIFPDNYFICSKTEFDGFLIIPFLWVVSVFFFDKKALKVKFIVKVLCVFLVSVIIFFVVFCFTSNVWVVSKNEISNVNIITREETSYSYDDIEKIELSYERRVSRYSLGKNISPVYNVFFNDGEEVYIYVVKSLYSSEDVVISFDKQVSEKRAVKGEFIYSENNKKFNNYYEPLFN